MEVQLGGNRVTVQVQSSGLGAALAINRESASAAEAAEAARAAAVEAQGGAETAQAAAAASAANAAAVLAGAVPKATDGSDFSQPGEILKNLTVQNAATDALPVPAYLKLTHQLHTAEFGAEDDGGVEDVTEALQKAFDAGYEVKKEIIHPAGEWLVTDTLKVQPGLRFRGAGGVGNYDASQCRIKFTPATKRPLITWVDDLEPTESVFPGTVIKGFCVRGFGAGASHCLDLPFLYGGELDFYAYAGVDVWVRAGMWMDTRVHGGVQGFNTYGVEFYNPGDDTSYVTTTTVFGEIYISHGPTGIFAGENSVIDCLIDGTVESVDVIADIERGGNGVNLRLYNENAPRTNAGAAYRVGKTGSGDPSSMVLALKPGIGYTGGSATETLLLDLDHAIDVRVSGRGSRHGAVLATTANTKAVTLGPLYLPGAPWLSFEDGIYDMAEVTMIGFRGDTLQTQGDDVYSDYDLAAGDLELFPRTPSDVTPRKLFCDGQTKQLVWKDTGGNRQQIGLFGAASAAATFNGAPRAKGELGVCTTVGAGEPVGFYSEYYSADTEEIVLYGTTTAGSPIITHTNPAQYVDLNVGDWVFLTRSVATGSEPMPSPTAQYRIIDKAANSNTITLDTNAAASVTENVDVRRPAHSLLPFGQQDCRRCEGDPTGNLTPKRFGEWVFDTVNEVFYDAFGTANTDWKARSA